MAVTFPTINSVVWEEGDPGGLVRGLEVDLYLVGNPGGGGPGLVTIPGRSQPFSMQVLGIFTDGTVPAVFTWRGTTVPVVRHGVTQNCIVTGVRVMQRTQVLHDNASKVCLVVAFDFSPE